MKRTLFLILLFITTAVSAQDLQRILDLRGTWKFELGKNREFVKPDFDDTDWEDIYVPSSWEDEGFANYDGFACYRKTFYLDEKLKAADLIIRLGYIDDASEIYLNGYFVGYSGMLPPHYVTAYDVEQQYPLLNKYLKYGKEKNVIAVRVYDNQQEGGMVRGQIGIYQNVSYSGKYALKLPETWKFADDDDPDFKSPDFDDSDWIKVSIPADWETQGFSDYDGIGWYRVKITIPESLKNDELIVLLGKIDDVDESYFNGKLIGKTGRIPAHGKTYDYNEEYKEIRAYEIPSELIQYGKENTIAVRVYDSYFHGGIYDGPLYIIKKSDFKPSKTKKSKYQFLKDMF